MSHRAPAVSFHALLSGLVRVGVDREELTRGIPFNFEVDPDPERSVPTALFRELWTRALRLTDDPTLPSRAGFAVPYGAFGLLDHLVSTAQTIGAALELLGGYLRLVATRVTLHLEDDAVIVENHDDGPDRRIASEWTLAATCAHFRDRQPHFALQEVRLAGADRRYEGAYAEIWGVPVITSASDTAMVLAPGVRDSATATADPSLHATLRTFADRIEFDGSGRNQFTLLVRNMLTELLREPNLSARAVAHQLGVSVRTLQRRLADEGLSFRGLLDDYRRELAVEAIKRGQQDLSLLATELGYQEQSSFSRAFRRWTNKSPRSMVAEVNAVR